MIARQSRSMLIVHVARVTLRRVLGPNKRESFYMGNLHVLRALYRKATPERVNSLPQSCEACG